MIYLDSCLLIYAVERHPVHGERVLAALADADAVFAASPLGELECLVAPVRDANVVLQRHYEALFARLRRLAIDDAVWEAAIALRARHGLRTPDALHLACAQRHGCSALWTHDNRLSRAAAGFAVDLLAGPR